MNRRNFILGLGTAATLSGAASVTGAALSDTVSPSADFRVIAAEELNLRDNEFLNRNNDANYTDTDPGSFDHNDTSSTSGTNLSVNDAVDGDLSLALATGNDPDQPENNFTSGRAPYVNDSTGVGTNADELNSTNTTGTETISNVPSDSEAPLQIVNETGADQSVGVQYNAGDASLGDDAGSGQSVSQAEVETLFQFFVYDDTEKNLKQISPDGSGGDEPYDYVDVPGGRKKQVHLVLNLTESIEQSIQEAAEATGTGGFSSGAEDDVDLLDTARFGIQS